MGGSSEFPSHVSRLVPIYTKSCLPPIEPLITTSDIDPALLCYARAKKRKGKQGNKGETKRGRAVSIQVPFVLPPFLPFDPVLATMSNSSGPLAPLSLTY